MKRWEGFIVMVVVLLVAFMLFTGARHTWNRTVMVQTYNRYCLDLVDSIPRDDDTTSDALHWAVGLATTLYDSIHIINPGETGTGGLCSLIFKYDCGYDTLGTYRFTLADSGTLSVPRYVYLDSVEVYVADTDTPFALKFSGYTKYAQE